MRTLVGVVGIILAIGIIGVVVTFLAYILAALLALGVVGLMLRGGQAVFGRRRHQESPKADLAEFEKSLRHPAWDAAIAQRRAQRQRLLDQFVALDGRISRLRLGPHYHTSPLFDVGREIALLEDELIAINGLMYQTFGHTYSRLQALQVDVEPPRDEVIHLDREFGLTGDCRYGHWGEHMIDEAGNGRVLRRCTYCEPNTRWTERV